MSAHADKLAALREAKQKREEAAREAAELRELEVLELEEKFTADLGARGVQFEIVETVEGPIVVKLGESVLHTRFQDAVSKDKINDATVDQYVFPCIVHPTKEKYREIVGRRPALALRCASALSTLFGAKDATDAGKF